MSFQWFILTFFLLKVSINGCACDSPTIVSTANDKQMNDKLIFANVIYRHGDRNINHIYPNDPWGDEEHWPDGGIGQLTKVGKIHNFQVNSSAFNFDFVFCRKESGNNTNWANISDDGTLNSLVISTQQIMFMFNRQTLTEQL